MSLEDRGSPLRERNRPRVRIADDPPQAPRARFKEQRERIIQFQRRWERIIADLPPQFTREHSTFLTFENRLSFSVNRNGSGAWQVGMISIGGVIGTGLFLGSGVRSYAPIIRVNPRSHYAGCIGTWGTRWSLYRVLHCWVRGLLSLRVNRRNDCISVRF